MGPWEMGTVWNPDPHNSLFLDLVDVGNPRIQHDIGRFARCNVGKDKMVAQPAFMDEATFLHRVLLLTQLTSTPHPGETSAILARTQPYLKDRQRIRKLCGENNIKRFITMTYE